MSLVQIILRVQCVWFWRKFRVWGFLYYCGRSILSSWSLIPLPRFIRFKCPYTTFNSLLCLFPSVFCISGTCWVFITRVLSSCLHIIVLVRHFLPSDFVLFVFIIRVLSSCLLIIVLVRHFLPSDFVLFYSATNKLLCESVKNWNRRCVIFVY
jgi:hypothetical protein